MNSVTIALEKDLRASGSADVGTCMNHADDFMEQDRHTDGPEHTSPTVVKPKNGTYMEQDSHNERPNTEQVNGLTE
jgi:hypothetical protein